MNKKLLILTIIPFLFLSFSFGQKVKVKIKKKIAYVDDDVYLNLEDCNTEVCTYKSMDGKEILIVQFDHFKKPNPVARNPKSKAPYSTTVTVYYGTVKFLDFELEFESEIASSGSRKQLIKALHKNGVIDMEGNVSETNAKKLAMKYGKDISGNRPTQIITN